MKNHLCYILIMPANLPPEYFEAGERFREAANPQDKAVALEELISTAPRHKGTDAYLPHLLKISCSIPIRSSTLPARKSTMSSIVFGPW